MSTEMRRWNEPVDTDWHTAGLCRTRTVSPQVWRLFDPVDLDEPKQVAWDRARLARDNFCAVCPVAAQCAAEGAEHGYEGVWGGEFRERRGIIDLDTGLVIRGDLRPVYAHATPEPADDPEPVPTSEPDPGPEPEPEPTRALAAVPAPPATPAADTARSRRPARIGFRRPRRHYPPTVGVQLTLDDMRVDHHRGRPTAPPVNEPAAGIPVAV